jgi:hypothetical protein
VTRGRRPAGPAVLTVGTLLLLAALPSCAAAVEGTPTPAAARDLPEAPEELEPLVVGEVPSGLPRLPDAQLQPPAGAKTLEDVAAYADDPARETAVLEEYGYRYGWERFWGEGDGWPTTGVFVDQFETRGGAAAYAADLARNDADLYGGVLRENPPHLPGGCRLLTVEDGQPAAGLPGPAAFAWCGHGVFSVSVTAVAGSVDEATDEVEAVLHSQLGRLPPG